MATTIYYCNLEFLQKEARPYLLFFVVAQLYALSVI